MITQNTFTYIFIIFFLLSPPCLTAGQTDIFLSTAASVLERSPIINMALENIEAAKREKASLSAKYLPQLSARVVGGENHEEYQDSLNDYTDFSSTLSLTQKLVDVANIYEIMAAQKQVEKATNTLFLIRQQVLLEFAMAWGEYWKALRQVDVNKGNLRILKEYLSATQTRYQGGDLTITDVRLAETRYQGALSQKSRFDREVFRKREVLREIMRMTVPEDIDLFDIREEKRSFLDTETAIAHHPLLSPMLSELNMLKKEIKKEKSGHFPSLLLVSEYMYQNKGEYASDRYPYEEGRIGFSVNIPLFKGGGVYQKSKKAVHMKRQQALKITKKKDEILRDIQATRYDFRQSVKELEFSSQQLSFAEKTLDGMTQEFEMGTRTSVDIFLAQADMIDAKLKVIVAKEQHHRFFFEYLFQLGMLDMTTLADKEIFRN